MRVNDKHVTIHQDADLNSPIIAIAIENGDPGTLRFRNDVRILELAIIGDLLHPAACGVVIEHFRLRTPYGDPVSDLGIALDHAGSVEKRETIACSEKPRSTHLSWPDNSVIMSGHLSYERGGDENGDENDENDDDGKWQYHIDDIHVAPRIAVFDPPNSFFWPTEKPIAAVLGPPNGPEKKTYYSNADFQTYIPLRPQRQTYTCSTGARHIFTFEPYGGKGAYRVTYSWIGTQKYIAPSSDLQGHDQAGNLFYEGQFNKKGALQQFKIPQAAVPLRPYRGFVSRILYDSGQVHPRTWVGSTTASINFTDADGNERHDRLRVQVYQDAFPEGNALSAYADGVGLVTMDGYRGTTVAFDCTLTQIENLGRSKAYKEKP